MPNSYSWRILLKLVGYLLYYKIVFREYIRETDTELIKHILFGNFWSFLLIISGIADIGIGVLIVTDVISIGNSPLPVFLACLAIGLIYLAAGLAIAVVKMKKLKN